MDSQTAAELAPPDILAGAAVALTAWFIARKRGRTEG